ncbi:uncharacterized protein BKCO1_4100031 [Diplodia corticola]|uniref:Uncharacterized protein n=1 Tax=Diplodia corticola TaxID=236234 RepID=A0A1J9QUK9_9PEZI|nr:uncharacterized protein BKCO1_4100031 [Diplodia corticola]OJD32089.1 hypothetical protein BKCO1_4100031 [Diplodia corticola]
MLLPAAYLLSFSSSVALAAVSVSDPGDSADLAADASDNAIKAVYDIEAILYQTNDIVGPYEYANGNDTTLDHTTLGVAANDTSVIVATEGTHLNLSHVDITKHGYSSNLYQASFYGLNAAINIANASTAHIAHTTITTHNGAANLFAYGADTVAHITASTLYSSGPVAHGLYAAGNATILASGIAHASGGNRCSSFAGDNPAGTVNVSSSVAHTSGVGSALFYALGAVAGVDVVGVAEKAPALFADGPQTAYFERVAFTAGLLAGTVVFSSAERGAEAARVAFVDSTLNVTHPDAPGLWFGNVVAVASLRGTEVKTASGVLVVANSSQVTQEFSYFAGAEENSAILPAVVEVGVAESGLVGDVVVYNGSRVGWGLSEHSTWTGKVVLAGEGVDGSVDVALDATSRWVVTGDSVVGNFTDEDEGLANVVSAGFAVRYDASAEGNAWLNGSTFALEGGGSLMPV